MDILDLYTRFNGRYKSTEFGSLYYLIPRELVVDDSITHIDAVDGIWLNYNQFSVRLNRSTGLNMKEYYNIVELGIDPSENLKCPICGSDLKFRNMAFGYRDFCSKSCLMKDRNSRSDELSRLSECMTRKNYEWNSLESSDSRCGIRTSIKSRRSEFINRGSPTDECYIYLVTDGLTYKYGITADPDTRSRFYRNSTAYRYGWRIIFNGTRVEVANLEASLKLNYGGSETFPSSILTEFISIFNKLAVRPIANPFD